MDQHARRIIEKAASVEKRALQRPFQGLVGAVVTGGGSRPEKAPAVAAIQHGKKIQKPDPQRARSGNQPRDRGDAPAEQFVARGKRLRHSGFRGAQLRHPVVLKMDHGVGMGADLLKSGRGLRGPAPPLEPERRRDDRNQESAGLLRDRSHGPPGSRGGPPAKAGTEKNDVRPRERILDFLKRFLRGIQPDFRVAPGSQPARGERAERNFHRSDRGRERELVGVDRHGFQAQPAGHRDPVGEVDPRVSEPHQPHHRSL